MLWEFSILLYSDENLFMYNIQLYIYIDVGRKH